MYSRKTLLFFNYFELQLIFIIYIGFVIGFVIFGEKFS